MPSSNFPPLLVDRISLKEIQTAFFQLPRSHLARLQPYRDPAVNHNHTYTYTCSSSSSGSFTTPRDLVPFIYQTYSPRSPRNTKHPHLSQCTLAPTILAVAGGVSIRKAPSALTAGNSTCDAPDLPRHLRNHAISSANFPQRCALNSRTTCPSWPCNATSCNFPPETVSVQTKKKKRKKNLPITPQNHQSRSRP